MALASRDFSIEQGSTFVLQFNLLDDYGYPLKTVTETSPGSYAIGKFSFAMKCRKSKYSGLTATLLDISGVTMLGTAASSDDGHTRDGFYVFAGTPGKVKFVISSPTTSSVKYGRHDYDIEIIETKTTGVENIRGFVGKMTFEAEATN
jgi:hypothetical protein